ncbi:MAG: hypothetical protein PHP26_08715 [Syntrophomonas sp.]|uniref:hypothetical protein n=1 Tax=Syntrophomonas sp. TaxID=2053627 RepID=UPI00262B095C|nr:hypothetical protein [Syntrophomonas sp.]MDD3880055.1 hypothetical protein [Syntrophomonas sp.]MDD4626421.1 hypothetical protein [Syntrophomonas sp.]
MGKVGLILLLISAFLEQLYLPKTKIRLAKIIQAIKRGYNLKMLEGAGLKALNILSRPGFLGNNLLL